MKRITSYLLPLMVVPFLASCGGGGTSQLTEVEFNKAIGFEGVTHLQLNSEFNLVGTTVNDDDTNMTDKLEISPTKNRETFTVTNSHDIEYEVDTYAGITKLSDPYCTYKYKRSGDDTWVETQLPTIYTFIIPSDLNPFGYFAYYEDITFEPEITYKNFTFQDNKYVYNGEGKYTPEPEPEKMDNANHKYLLTVEMTFNQNKKLEKFYSDYQDFREGSTEPDLEIKMNNSYTYEKIEPEDPSPNI